VLSHVSVTDDFGYHHVIGEIKNMRVDNVIVYIIAMFWDAKNKLVEKEYGVSLLLVIRPGMQAPFRVDYGSEKTKFSKIARYSLYTVYFTLNEVRLPEPSIKLEIISHRRHMDGQGFLHIVGELENQGGDTKNARVIFTGYDGDGKLVWVATSYASPQDLKEDQRAPFDIAIYSRATVPSIKNYALIAESSDYQSEPIFESQHETLTIRYVNQTIFTPSASVRVVPDRATYTLGGTVWLAGEGMFNAPPWITMTWLNWPANVRIKGPSGEYLYNTIVGVYPPQPTTIFTRAYEIPNTAKTGVYTIEAVMTPAYPHWIMEEKAVIDGRTLTITTITETKTWRIAFYSTEFTVIGELPTPQAFLGVALILGLLAFRRLTRRTKR
jgi:hypothetical protein